MEEDDSVVVEEEEMTLSVQQKYAVEMALQGYCVVITGGFFSGKYTAAATIANSLIEKGNSVTSVGADSYSATRYQLAGWLDDWINQSRSDHKDSQRLVHTDTLIVIGLRTSLSSLSTLSEAAMKARNNCDTLFGGMQVIVTLNPKEMRTPFADDLKSAGNLKGIWSLFLPHMLVHLPGSFVHSQQDMEFLDNVLYDQETLAPNIGQELSPTNQKNTTVGMVFQSGPVTEDCVKTLIGKPNTSTFKVDATEVFTSKRPKANVSDLYRSKKSGKPEPKDRPGYDEMTLLYKILGSLHRTLFLTRGLRLVVTSDINEHFTEGTVATVVGFCAAKLGRVRQPIICKDPEESARLMDIKSVTTNGSITELKKMKLLSSGLGVKMASSHKSHPRGDVSSQSQDTIPDEEWVHLTSCVILTKQPHSITVPLGELKVDQMPVTYKDIITLPTKEPIEDGFKINANKIFQTMTSRQYYSMVGRFRHPCNVVPPCKVVPAFTGPVPEQERRLGLILNGIDFEKRMQNLKV